MKNNVCLIAFSLVSIFSFIGFSNECAWFEKTMDMQSNISESLGGGAHAISQVGGVLGPLLVATRSTNDIPSEAMTLPLSVIRSDSEGSSILPLVGTAAVGATMLGAAAYMLKTPPPEQDLANSQLIIALRLWGSVAEMQRDNQKEYENSWSKYFLDKWDAWGSNAKTTAKAVGSAGAVVGTSVIANTYVQTQVLKYLHRKITPEEKKSIVHSTPEEKPKPTKYDGSYITPLGDYTLSELLELSQAEAALGKRGPFSEMMLYVMREQNSIPIDAKKNS